MINPPYGELASAVPRQRASIQCQPRDAQLVRLKGRQVRRTSSSGCMEGYHHVLAIGAKLDGAYLRRKDRHSRQHSVDLRSSHRTVGDGHLLVTPGLPEDTSPVSTPAKGQAGPIFQASGRCMKGIQWLAQGSFHVGDLAFRLCRGVQWHRWTAAAAGLDRAGNRVHGSPLTSVGVGCLGRDRCCRFERHRVTW